MIFPPEVKREKHRVAIEFDVMVAPEHADAVKLAILDRLYTSMALDNTLGCKLYSFEYPEIVSKIIARVTKIG